MAVFIAIDRPFNVLIMWWTISVWCKSRFDEWLLGFTAISPIFYLIFVFYVNGYTIFSGDKLKSTKVEVDSEEGKSEESERECDSDKEDAKRKRKRADEGASVKEETKGDEKLSTPSGSSTTSQGTNGSTSPDMKRRRLTESPLTSNSEVSPIYLSLLKRLRLLKRFEKNFICCICPSWISLVRFTAFSVKDVQMISTNHRKPSVVEKISMVGSSSCYVYSPEGTVIHCLFQTLDLGEILVRASHFVVCLPFFLWGKTGQTYGQVVPYY